MSRHSGNRQADILNTAEHFARKSGYTGFSFADIAGVVGIQKASIHHHFPTKGDLATAMLRRYSDHTMEHLNRLDGTAGQRLAAFVALYRDALDDGRALCLCVSLAAGRETLPDAARAQVAWFNDKVLAWLERVFADAQCDGTVARVSLPQEEARGALAMVQGAQLMAHAAGAPQMFEHATELFTQRLSKET